MTHPLTEVVRWAALAQLLIVLFGAALIAAAYRRWMPDGTFWVLVALGWIVLAVTVGLAANIVSVPPTPGSQILASLMPPATIGVVVHAVRVVRDERSRR